MSGESNSRRSPRYQIVLPVSYQATPKGGHASIEGSGWTRNLSETGACLELTEPLPAGTPLNLVLLDEGGSLALEAKVVWVGYPCLPSGGSLHGVIFPQVTSDQRQALRKLIRRRGGLRLWATRIPAALPAKCRPLGASGAPVRGWTGDLSWEGCLLHLSDQLPVGTLIEVTLTMPRGDFTAKATVVWVKPPRRVVTRQLARHGVRFVEVTWTRDDLAGLIMDGIPTEVGQEPKAD
jgi:hypothetical protein